AKPVYLLQGSTTSITCAVDKNKFLIEQFKDKREFLYNYSKMKYKSQKQKVEIICDKHGSFWQTPDSHKKGHGCKQCGLENAYIKKQEIIERLQKLRSGFTYDMSSFSKLEDYIKITCSFGHNYKQRVVEHLNG